MWNIRFSVFLLFYFLSEGNGSLEAGDTTRYLIYSVNPGEGFNLRRDVHMRAASLVQQLRRETKENWVLVLPPWPRLYHWKTNGIKQTNVKWEVFFDLPSLNEYVPTIEFDDYITQEGEKIDEVGYRYLIYSSEVQFHTIHSNSHHVKLYPTSVSLEKIPKVSISV